MGAENSDQFKPKIIPEDIGDFIDYNPETGVLTNKVDRGQRIKKDQVTGCKGKFYTHIIFRWLNYPAHRVCYFLHTGVDPKEMYVDHIDGDGHNNKFSNLRLVTKKENSRNSKRPSNNSSGVTGVTWHKLKSKWQAQVCDNYKIKHLGTFDNFEEAVAVRIAAEHRFYGKHRNDHNDKCKLTPEMLEWGKEYLEDKIERFNWDA